MTTGLSEVTALGSHPFVRQVLQADLPSLRTVRDADGSDHSEKVTSTAWL